MRSFNQELYQDLWRDICTFQAWFVRCEYFTKSRQPEISHPPADRRLVSRRCEQWNPTLALPRGGTVVFGGFIWGVLKTRGLNLEFHIHSGEFLATLKDVTTNWWFIEPVEESGRNFPRQHHSKVVNGYHSHRVVSKSQANPATLLKLNSFWIIKMSCPILLSFLCMVLLMTYTSDIWDGSSVGFSNPSQSLRSLAHRCVADLWCGSLRKNGLDMIR